MNFGRRREFLNQNPSLYTPTNKERQMILASRQPELLREYYDKVSEYYKYFISYNEIKQSYNDIGVYDEVIKIKKNMRVSYIGFLKTRKLY